MPNLRPYSDVFVKIRIIGRGFIGWRPSGFVEPKFWKEGTRLEPAVVIDAGVLIQLQSLEMFVEESGTVLKRVLQRYSDNLQYVLVSNFKLSLLTRISQGDL